MHGVTDSAMLNHAVRQIVAALTYAVVAVVSPSVALADTDNGQSDAPAAVIDIANGAWELGFTGSVVSREGAVNSTLAVFTNRFWTTSVVALSAGGVMAYSRVSDLDRVDLEGLFAVYRQLEGSTAFGFVGVGGGLRQEWVGSFSQARYPLGLDVGIKALVSRRAAVTVAYQYRRMLNDPVADFSEHRFVTGISLFIHNDKE
ncbi:MAG: hypothetical protein KAJ37_02990 [Candidatus Krumholzibacteria bacterium]|nr:hypothetical protein [Candidatus Krumholzibacteria bacterium]